MNIQLHLPTAIWEGEQGVCLGDLEPESVQDMEGGGRGGGGTKSLSIAARRENANSKQRNKSSIRATSTMYLLKAIIRNPPTFFFFLKTKWQKPALSLVLGVVLVFLLKTQNQNGQNVWRKAEKHFLFACQTLERSKQVKIIILITNKSNKIKPENNKKTPWGYLSGLSNNAVLIFQLPYIQACNRGWTANLNAAEGLLKMLWYMCV